jgi:AraC family transcriptional regulator
MKLESRSFIPAEARSMSESRSGLPLPFGQFLGARTRYLVTNGLAFAELVHPAYQRVSEHTHVDAHFVVILAGEYLTAARAVDARCGACTVIFNPPGTTHRDGFLSSHGRFFTVSISPERLDQMERCGVSRDEAVGFRSGEVVALAARAYGELRGGDPLSPVILEGLALELLGRTARRARPGRDACPPWLIQAQELIRDRCTSDVTLSEIAGEVGVHPYHLARSYRKHFGQTPGDHLRACRIQHAHALLQRTRLPLAEVATRCGYADQSQFTRSFKRAMGMPPGTFRAENHVV